MILAMRGAGLAVERRRGADFYKLYSRCTAAARKMSFAGKMLTL